MGQKINPISLRLQTTNRSFDSCWYNNYYYSELLSQDLKIRIYLQSILKQIEFPSARFFIQTFQKKTRLFVFFCSPSLSRKIRTKNFNLKIYDIKKLKRTSPTKLKKIKDTNSYRAEKERVNNFFLHSFLISTFLVSKNETNCRNLFSRFLMRKNGENFQKLRLKKNLFISNKSRNDASSLSLKKNISSLSSILTPTYSYRNHMEYVLSKQLNINFELFPIRVSNDFRSALFLAEEIVYYIERRVPFRKIKNKILKEVSLFSQIKGLRIACSGRVGGRSKKAQRAKTESFKYGQTSLHVFSSQIDFAAKTAITPFGAIGVKIWICYR